MDVLGININNLSKEQILGRINFFLSENKFHQIATINPEFTLEAQKNLRFRKVLNSCDLNIADGFGIKLAFLRFGRKLKCRLAGADLMMEILKIAQEKKLPIFLAINKDGLSSFEEIKEAILKIYPDLEIEGENLDCHSCESENPIANFKDPALDSHFRGNDVILFCNFGSPQQEFFINSLKYDNIRLAMGVGGAFDFITKKIRRAPKFLRFFGLEWLWRLIQQPKRIKRIFRAIVMFPIKVIFKK